MALAAGDRLGPYRIVSQIGKGGMGEVYRATDTRMGRDVAVKLVTGQFSERFTREVRAIAALNHPNICTIHDVGPNYLVMEYLDGSPVEGPLPEPKAIALAQQIAAALEAAHIKGVIHRDLKPRNILVTADGVKLLDFGIATLAREENSTASVTPNGPAPPQTAIPSASDDDLETLPSLTGPTRAGDVLGTPAYMSPEQAAGTPVDAGSDIFSFGVTLYEMLTGRQPFASDTLPGMIAAIRYAEPDPIEATPEVAQVVARCLRKTAAERYRSVLELRLALDKAAAALAQRTPSVAVLPFQSSLPEHEYFGDGLAEDIINALSRVGGLRVIARKSTFAFKHRAQDVREIARALDVDHILEGSVRTAGHRIRITAQLITAKDGTQLWSKRYDRDLTDVFEIQDEISNAIAMELKVSLAGRPLVKPPTVHFAAYEAVLQGRHHFFRFDVRTIFILVTEHTDTVAYFDFGEGAGLGILELCRARSITAVHQLVIWLDGDALDILGSQTGRYADHNRLGRRIERGNRADSTALFPFGARLLVEIREVRLGIHDEGSGRTQSAAFRRPGPGKYAVADPDIL